MKTIEEIIGETLELDRRHPEPEEPSEAEVERMKLEMHESLFDGIEQGKNAIYERIPSWTSGYRPKLDEFDMQEDLFSIEWVNRWQAPVKMSFWSVLLGYKSRYIFHEWSMSRGGHLMAWFNEGRDRWFVGYIRYPDEINLPSSRRGVQSIARKIGG